jgi:prepilin-type N-terminal cleavage/methylation domain-containing protein
VLYTRLSNSVNVNRRAFSLIEVMVAMFVLAVAGGAILMGLMLSLSQGKESQERVMAQIIAGSVIDELKAHPYGSTKPLAGWQSDGQSFTRQQTVATIVNGLESPIPYQMKITPVASTQDGADEVQVEIDWNEPSGPAKMDFKVPMTKGWNQAVNRGDQPGKVQARWHNPKAYTIPSEPSYSVGSQDHTVNPDPPDSGTIINKKTKAYQALYNQLANLKTQLLTAQDAVTSDKSQITSLKSQIKTAQGQKKPDQTAISKLQTQLSKVETKLSTDQTSVTTIQGQMTAVQAKITAAGGAPSPSPSPAG